MLAAAVACDDSELVVANVHLSLGTLDQHKQLRFIRNCLSAYPDVLITGDFNCTPDAPQLQILTRHGYRRLGDDAPTFPSWKPHKALDHALLKGAFVGDCRVSHHADSDHLPLLVEVE